MQEARRQWWGSSKTLSGSPGPPAVYAARRGRSRGVHPDAPNGEPTAWLRSFRCSRCWVPSEAACVCRPVSPSRKQGSLRIPCSRVFLKDRNLSYDSGENFGVFHHNHTSSRVQRDLELWNPVAPRTPPTTPNRPAPRAIDLKVLRNSLPL